MSDASLSLKLAIRNDPEAGMVRAFVATLDGVKMFELGSIHVGLLNGRDDALFRAWQAVMKQAMERGIEFIDGVKVEGWSGADRRRGGCITRQVLSKRTR